MICCPPLIPKDLAYSASRGYMGAELIIFRPEEGTMNKAKNYLNVLALSVLAASFFGAGCENKEVLKALTDSTAQLSEQAKTTQASFAELTAQLNTCKTNLATAIGGEAAAPVETPTFELPTVKEGAKIKDLEAYKTALTDLIAKQEAKVTELKTAAGACAQELTAANEKAEAAKKEAEEAAAAEAAAKAKKKGKGKK